MAHKDMELRQWSMTIPAWFDRGTTDKMRKIAFVVATDVVMLKVSDPFGRKDFIK